MALIKCPECSKEISDQSKSCPHCGYRLNSMSAEEKGNIKRVIFWIIGIIVAIILIVVVYDACTTSTDELKDNLKKSQQELSETKERLDDLKRKKAINDWLINYYEDND